MNAIKMKSGLFPILAVAAIGAVTTGYSAYVSSYPATAASGSTLSSLEWNKMVSALQTLDTNLSAFTVSGGKVGIGTTPSHALDILTTGGSEAAIQASSTGDVHINLRSGTGLHQFLRFFENTTGKWEVGNSSGASNKFYFNPNVGVGITNAAMVITHDGNVGIGTISPTQKLEINGNLKFAQNGSIISKAPRSVRAIDSTAGCPSARAANTDLWTLPISVERPATVMLIANSIKNSSLRADLQLFVDGTQVNQTIAPPMVGDWVGASVQWTGTLGAGSHTISVRSPQANVWGCTTWGAIDALIFEN